MKPLIAALAASALLLPASAFAYQQGDVLLRVGVTSVQPDDRYKPAGVRADDDTRLGLNITYMLADNLGLELLLATPFEHDIQLEGTGTVGSTKHLPPTLSLQYYFTNNSPLTPYLGAGVNYTVFFDADLKEGGAGSIQLKDSTGVALQLGADYAINNNWGPNLDIRWMDIDTYIESASAAGAGFVGTNVTIDPMVYSLTALYRF